MLVNEITECVLFTLLSREKQDRGQLSGDSGLWVKVSLCLMCKHEAKEHSVFPRAQRNQSQGLSMQLSF